MKLPKTSVLAACASLIHVCIGVFQVSPVSDAMQLARAIFSEDHINILSASFQPRVHIDSVGSFTNGPFGLGHGAILSTGRADQAMKGGTGNHDMGGSGSKYCGVGSTDRTVLFVDFETTAEIEGLEVEFVLATNEYFA